MSFVHVLAGLAVTIEDMARVDEPKMLRKIFEPHPEVDRVRNVRNVELIEESSCPAGITHAPTSRPFRPTPGVAQLHQTDAVDSPNVHNGIREAEEEANVLVHLELTGAAVASGDCRAYQPTPKMIALAVMPSFFCSTTIPFFPTDGPIDLKAWRLQLSFGSSTLSKVTVVSEFARVSLGNIFRLQLRSSVVGGES